MNVHIGDPDVSRLCLRKTLLFLDRANLPLSRQLASSCLPFGVHGDPRLWFAQVEAQFQTRKISAQKTKFDYVVASLSPEVATEVRDLIISPPSDDPYDNLRQALIERTSQSERCRLQHLLSNQQELGDLKPTRLLRRLQLLLGDTAREADGPLFRELFLQRLPSSVRVALASLDTDLTLQQLAERADHMVEAAASPFTTMVSGVSTSEQSLHAAITQLKAEVCDLKSQVQRVSTAKQWKESPMRQKRGALATEPPTLCWYHSRFGDSARKCKAPCAQAGNFVADH